MTWWLSHVHSSGGRVVVNTCLHVNIVMVVVVVEVGGGGDGQSEGGGGGQSERSGGGWLVDVAAIAILMDHSQLICCILYT